MGLEHTFQTANVLYLCNSYEVFLRCFPPLPFYLDTNIKRVFEDSFIALSISGGFQPHQ